MRSMVEGVRQLGPLRHTADAARHLPQQGEETVRPIPHAATFAFFTCDSRAVSAPGVMPSMRPA